MLIRRGRKKKPWVKVDWTKAEDVQERVALLVEKLDLEWVDIERIYCFRSSTSKARAYARIWGLSKIWQLALGEKPAYAIEVLAQHFDHLPDRKKDEVLLHELTHIPKNFSGSLMPHTKVRGKRNFHDKVDQLIAMYDRIFK